ncbi:MAG: arginine--tRNA ligase [bacterium]|nr:arginine--tRNA ligase [bacterium]
MSINEEIISMLKKTVLSATTTGRIPDVGLLDIQIDYPKRQEYGNLSTNIAFLIAKKISTSPYLVAQIIIESMEKIEGLISRVEIAGGGFINFWVSKERLYKVLKEIEETNESYGTSNIGQGEKVLIDFVSANPTGPLHVGHGRGADYGDILANILAFCGYKVTREYYINDVGTQMRTLGESLKARYLQLLGQDVQLPENGYKGEYMVEIARTLHRQERDTCRNEEVGFFTNFAKESILEDIRKTLIDFGIQYDSWFSEKELYDSNQVDEVIDSLKKLGFTYESEGALWLKTTAFGDEKDRVLIRQNGEYTYFAGDIAYHKNKYDRGYDVLINAWGTDHHGYIKRLEAAMSALGYPANNLVFLLCQLVSLIRDNQPVSMSTRAGEFVTLSELIKEVGQDVARFFFVMRKMNSHLEFDLNLAKQSSKENPVYYIQYVHARTCSILSRAKEKGLSLNQTADLNLLKLDEELALIFKLASLPQEIINCARFYEPHGLTAYLIELAGIFHNYYQHHRVISANKELSQARLVLVNAVRIVIRNTLTLLGLTAPQRM